MPSTDHHQIHSTTEPDCYFSIVSTSSNHYSTETPLATPELWLESPNLLSDPHNPLLALRPASALFNNHMDASRLMQHQTAAAHSSARSASKSSPWQDVLHVDYEGSHAYSRSNSSSSTTSNSSTSSTLSTCSRCQTQGDTGFLRYAMNSYYCPRCAKIVGYGT